VGECPLLAQSRHALVHYTCPLLEVKRIMPSMTGVQTRYAATPFFIVNASMCSDHDSKASRTSLA
jgi:hypothetical protein